MNVKGDCINKEIDHDIVLSPIIGCEAQKNAIGVK
jgi:hypothetical protein